MNKKIFLTSFIALGFACPAMAEPAYKDDFPKDGLMQADYTYPDAAVSDNMAGVSDDNATVYANAQFHNMDYTVNAGEYLPADAEAVATCTAGSFCPGLQSPVNYNDKDAQGITACPSGFGNSAAGSTANTDCYRTCDINNMGANGTIANIPNAATLTGNDYYGNGADTCEPATCMAGWHVKVEGSTLENSIGTSQNVNSASIRGYEAYYRENTYNDGSYHGRDYYDFDEGTNVWAVDYGDHGILYGVGVCSDREGVDWGATNSWNNGTYITNGNIVPSLEEDEKGEVIRGPHCYCKITGYKPKDSSVKYNVSSQYAYLRTLSDVYVQWNDSIITGEYNCFNDGDNGCAVSCGTWIGGRGLSVEDNDTSSMYSYRAAIFATVGKFGGLNSCEANTININWSDTTKDAVEENDAGSVTYGGDIRTPKSVIVPKGKVFEGWEFSTTAPSNGN